MGYETIVVDTWGLYSISDVVKTSGGVSKIKVVVEGNQTNQMVGVFYVVCDEHCLFGYAHHRLDGPALIGPYGIGFYINDNPYRYTEAYCRVAGMSDEETLVWIFRFGEELPMTPERYYGEDWESIPVDQL